MVPPQKKTESSHLNRIQGLFKTTTKIQDFFKIVRSVERVLAVRTCEKNVGGGGGLGGNLAKGDWWQFLNGKYAFKFDRLENDLRGTQTR